MTVIQKEEVLCINKRHKYVFNTLLALGIVTTSLLVIASGFALSKEFSGSEGDMAKATTFFICSIVILALLLSLIVFREKQIISESKEPTIKQDRVEDKIESIQESVKLEREDSVEYKNSVHFELSQMDGKLYMSTPKKKDELRVSWKENIIINERREALEDALDMTQRELKRVEEEVEEKRISLTKLEKKIEEMEGQRSELKKDIEDKEQEIKRKKSTFNGLKMGIKEANNELNKLTGEIRGKKDELSKLDKKIRGRGDKLSELEKEIEILEGEKDELDKIFRRKEKQKEELNKSFEIKKEARKRLDESFEIKDDSFERKKEEKEELNKNIKLLKGKAFECISCNLGNKAI